MNFLQNEDNEDNDVFIEAELLRGMYPEDDKLQMINNRYVDRCTHFFKLIHFY